ncbi:hypothetical protein GGI15_003450 [Coemansia interrupta]|uniref:Glutathione S-transferase n=1 Tax=Coemansia interrupta TaxID=1126814 RepID=A0A9W8H7A4_9FUNG|nr:hypothetical protein GGI15_003450 [Coemansia interrupta]
MSSFVLRYFPVHSRAETIKAIFSYAETDYKYETPEWPLQKSEQPAGKLPVLVETLPDSSEYVLSDSLAIESYLVDKFKLSVSGSPQIIARQQEIRYQIKDIFEACTLYRYATPEAKHMFLDYFLSSTKDIVAYHEKLLTENGSNGHYFGDSITYVDLAAFATYRAIELQLGDSTPQALELFSKKNAPLMNQVFETVAGQPTIASYLATFN